MLTGLTRRYIDPVIVDVTYRSNVLTFRLMEANKKVIQGGYQYELPINYARMTSGGAYAGFDQLDTTPQDVIKNAAWDWKQYYMTIAIDGATLRKNDQPEAVANIVTSYWEIAHEQMAENIGVDMFSDSSNVKTLDGLRGAIDNGTVLATYAGLGARTTTNSFWQPGGGVAAAALDTTTATLSLPALRAVMGAATEGMRHTTLHVTTQSNYNRFWILMQPQQRFPSEPQARDEQLVQAGFSNLAFDGAPVVVDSHCTTAGTFASPNAGDHWYMLNEDYLEWAVMSGRDMETHDFQEALNQDGYVSKLLGMFNLIVKNPARQGKLTALTA